MDVHDLFPLKPQPTGVLRFVLPQPLIDVIENLEPGKFIRLVTKSGREVSVVLTEDLEHLLGLARMNRK